MPKGPGRRQITVLYLEPKRAAATIGYALMTLVFLALAAAALAYRTDAWPARWRPDVQLPDSAPLVAAAATGFLALVSFVAAIANGRRWHTANAIERLSEDPALADVIPRREPEPSASRAAVIPHLEVRLVKARALAKPRGLRRVRSDRNIVGRRPLKIAYLRLFENQPRLRTFIEGAWREFGAVYLLRSAASVTTAEYRSARRSGDLRSLFISSPDRLLPVVDPPVGGPNPRGRSTIRSVGGTRIRVRDRYGAYPIHALLVHGGYWKQAVDLLLARMDLAVLDLSGFRPQNVGTEYEVQRLIDRFPIERVVFLADQRSDGRFLVAELQQAWSRMASGSPNATAGPRLAMIVITDYFARSQSQPGGQGQATQTQVRLVARRSQTRRVAAMAQERLGG